MQAMASWIQAQACLKARPGTCSWPRPRQATWEAMEIQDRDRPGCDGKRVKEDGWNRGNIYGAYIHGIFDHPGIAETIVSSLAAKKGISMDEVKAGDYSAYRQQQYDKLADVLRSSLDMDAIYKMMGL